MLEEIQENTFPKLLLFASSVQGRVTYFLGRSERANFHQLTAQTE
jgi:hypothetical protein